MNFSISARSAGFVGTVRGEDRPGRPVPHEITEHDVQRTVDGRPVVAIRDNEQRSGVAEPATQASVQVDDG